MAVIWIVTTGNSDFKLERKDGFGHLREEKNSDLKPCQKKFGELIQGDDNLFYLPARVMGILYGDAWATHEEHFQFPLLKEFTKELKKNGKIPDRIIVLLTNQEKIFLEDSNDPRYDRAENSPYWKDTYCLEPIFKHYFDQEFGEGKVQFPFPVLEPKTREQGLDNWDSTLKLVQEEFEKWKISESDSVIVSHQASTPAISSAVQFVSLAKFGDKVDFLFVNERDSDLTRFLEGSEYLKGIRKREAMTLLSRPDYPGIQTLIESYLKKDSDTQKLLNAAIQWNFAEFGSFADGLEKLSDQKFQNLVQEVKERRKYWWWEAYEAAYLGVVRLEQKNTVEAMFHSFRAVEGLTSKWAVTFFPDDIEDRDGQPVAILRNSSKLPKYLLEELENLKTEGKLPEIKLYGERLFKLFRESKPDLQKNADLKTLWNCARNIRNQQFHRLQGLDEKSLFKAWGMNSEDSWKKRLLNCLNLISDQKQFQSLKKASLMVKVHRELVEAIANL